ncbi:hypothetical protein WOC76_04385 [Methylocystis sp. IM3]|uniref:hypothetical protein n=1 Tax=Methylocystis sp. IM3 TaxID=3136722 RepID=UPI00311A7744
MKLVPSLTRKIATMIPRLASDYEGEIVATARAIGRVLNGANADWHDVVVAFERGAVAPENVRKKEPRRSKHSDRQSVRSWWELDDDERLEAVDYLIQQKWLSAWERTFIESIADQLHRHDLTDKQIAVVDRLLARAFRGTR